MALDLEILGKKLRRYREQFEFSISEIANASGISAERLVAFEKGERFPTGDDILILSDVYKCDYKFFVSNERLAPFEQTDVLFRRFGNAFSKKDRWAVQEFLYLSDNELFLQRALNKSDPKIFAFTKTGTNFKRHGAHAADQLRRFLGYSDHQVPRNVFEDFRSLGIHVFRKRLDNSNISGLYVKHPVAGNCILIDYSEDVYRQRFSAAHEAAHTILDADEEVLVSFIKHQSDYREIRANAFASHFLMPPAFLRSLPEPQRWDTEKALHWANELRVSTEALSIALIQARLIDAKTQKIIKAVRVPRKNKVDPELPLTLAPRSHERKEGMLKRGLSDYYVRLCSDAYREGVVSVERLAELLLLQGESELRELAELYGVMLFYGD